MMQKIKFDKKFSTEFITSLRNSVEEYFKKNNLSKHGNYNMVLKTIFMLALFFVPYGFIISGHFQFGYVLILLWITMGFGLAGIGLSIMHDGNHGSYSKHRIINTLMGMTLNMVGGSSKNWKIQHNRMHHTFTNVHDMDPDVGSGQPMLRFSPKAKKYWFHRYQYIYAWFFYGLMTLSWATIKEFKQLSVFREDQLIKKEEYWPLMLEMVLWKIIYYGYLLVIPILLIDDLLFTQWLICFLSMHFVAGIILSTIFQTAHIMPECKYPEPNNTGHIENDWAIHQLETTSNYAPNSRFFSWYVGGLNYQIEHHLFPKICHVHYRDISKIVKRKAEEYNIPYYCQKNYAIAMIEHGKMLYKLGR